MILMCLISGDMLELIMMKNIDSIRPSPIAGSWYSSDPQELAQTIDAYLRAAEPQTLPGEVVGLVAPHAGHIYSGPVAAYAYKTIMGHHYDHVAVLSPLHPFDSHPVLTSAHSAYETPLGTLPINKDLVAAIDTALNAKTGSTSQPLSKTGNIPLKLNCPSCKGPLPGHMTSFQS